MRKTFLKKLAKITAAVVLGSLIMSVCSAQKSSSSAQTNRNPNGRNDAWGYIGIGGGGAMFFPAFSPHNPEVAFIACDMGGGYVTCNGGKNWRMFNLDGRVHYYVFDQLDANVVYAATTGLYKSTDKGNTWRLIYPAPADVAGIVAKDDHAQNVIATKDNTIRQVLALAVDPANSKKLYAGISINKVTALYTSTDSGLQWNKEKDLEDGINNIFIDPSSPKNSRTVYVTGNNTIAQLKSGEWLINKGPEAGATFTEVSGGYSAKQGRFYIYGIARGQGADGKATSTIYTTSNGGESWQNIQQGLLAFGAKGAALPNWRTLATSARHPEVLYVSYDNLKINDSVTLIGVAKSTDYGRTWALVWKDRLMKGCMQPTANFSDDWLNSRFGPTWGENPLCLGVAPTNPNICFGTDFGRTIKTSDGGKTWQQVYSKKAQGGGWSSTGLEVTTGYRVVFNPFDKQHVFMANTDIGLLESHDGTKSWLSATKNNGVPGAWENTCYWLTFDAQVKGRAWAVMSGVHDLPRPKMFRHNGVKGYTGGVLLTENSGRTWQPVSSTIGEAAMTHIIYDPTSNTQARTLYACAFGKGVYKSVDGGKTWVQKNTGIEETEPFAWQITRRESDGALFLVVSRRSEDGSIGNDKDGALYCSYNGAESWSRITLPRGTNGPTSLVAHNGHKLVLAAWGRKTPGLFTPDTGGGIYVSNDEGRNWQQVMQHDQHISDITYDERVNRYYACGFESSAYYSEDGGSNWTRIKGYNFKWGKRVEMDPADAEKVYIITFGGGVWHGPAKGDASAVEDVVK